MLRADVARRLALNESVSIPISDIIAGYSMCGIREYVADISGSTRLAVFTTKLRLLSHGYTVTEGDNCLKIQW